MLKTYVTCVFSKEQYVTYKQYVHVLLRSLLICGDGYVCSQYQISMNDSDIEPQSKYKMSNVSTFTENYYL